MSDIEKVLAIVGIIWLAHIPFVIPFIMAAANSEKPKEKAQPAPPTNVEDPGGTLAQAS